VDAGLTYLIVKSYLAAVAFQTIAACKVVMKTFFDGLRNTEGGRRFLLNLYWGLEDGLDPELVGTLIEHAARSVPTGELDSFFPERAQLRAAVYDAPDRYQFKGRPPSAAQGRWMTVKSADDLRTLILQGLAPTEDLFSDIFPGVPVKESLRDLQESQLREIADAVNDPMNELNFRLALEWPAPPSSNLPRGTQRQVPGWFSRWCVFEQTFPDLRIPAEEAASRLRNWLGLEKYGVGQPLFIIRTRQTLHSDELDAHRPTVLDGIEGLLFKHRIGVSFPWTGCGSAADMSLLSDKAGDGAIAVGDAPDIDGGPELVSRNAHFDPAIHECMFLGRPNGLPWDPFGHFHTFLLPPRTDLEAVIAYVIARLPSKMREVVT
jgi:hypothetical protein